MREVGSGMKEKLESMSKEELVEKIGALLVDRTFRAGQIAQAFADFEEGRMEIRKERLPAEMEVIRLGEISDELSRTMIIAAMTWTAVELKERMDLGVSAVPEGVEELMAQAPEMFREFMTIAGLGEIFETKTETKTEEKKEILH
jgi:hypothetical protein